MNKSKLERLIKALRHCYGRSEDNTGFCEGCPYEHEGEHENGTTCPILRDAARALERYYFEADI